MNTHDIDPKRARELIDDTTALMRAQAWWKTEGRDRWGDILFFKVITPFGGFTREQLEEAP